MQIRKLSYEANPAGLSKWAALVVLAAVAFQAERFAAQAAGAEETGKRKSSEFVRIRLDAKQRPLALETATVRYTRDGADGTKQVVDLIGVVHIGEKAYYEVLNEQFQQYEALLYELVAPEGTRVPKGGRKNSGADPLSGLQTGMKDMLGLEFQLDHIDYHQDNFVHADMSPQEFVESMSKNDESFAKMFFRMLGSSMAAQGSGATMDEADLLMAMFASDRELKMRRIMAQQLSSMELAMVAFDGADGSTIINHRNGKCFEVLDRELERGKKRLGVFFGAGHLPDMETRLLEKGFKRDGATQWYVAWALTREPLDTVVPQDAEPVADAADESVQAESSPSDIQPGVEPPPAPVVADETDETATADASASTAGARPCKATPTRKRGRLFRRKR